jgi:hypothetical protein
VSVSARLSSKTQLALARYCKAHGLTKTQALERGIHLLLRHEGEGAHHPAFLAYQRVRDQKFPSAAGRESQESTESIKRYLDAKHSR